MSIFISFYFFVVAEVGGKYLFLHCSFNIRYPEDNFQLGSLYSFTIRVFNKTFPNFTPKFQ